MTPESPSSFDVQSESLSRQLSLCTQENGKLDTQKLIRIVDESYIIAEQEQYLYQHSLALMSEELTYLNQDLKQQADDLLESETRYALASKGTHDGLWDWDIVRDRCFYSERWKEMIGFDTSDHFETLDDWLARIASNHYQTVRTSLFNHLEGKTERFEVEYQIKCIDGRLLWVLTRGTAARDENGKATRIAGSQTDISQRKKHEEQLYHAAYHDKLTGLPNRVLFMDRLRQTVRSFKRTRPKNAALIFLDLDRFKIINDSLGHEAGDQLLMSVSRRLEVVVRPSDTVCRLGGDEFTILLHEIDEEDDAKLTADRLIDEISKPYFIYGQQLYVSGSAGVVIINGYDNPENLMRNADLAMYQAKHKGKSRAETFEKKQYDSIYNTLQLETDLRSAIKNYEFVPYFQPIVNLKTGSVDNLEALARWIHPQRGLIPPIQFIPIAEETGLILDMSEFLMESVCQQIQEWEKAYGSQWSPSVAVNLSVKQLFNPSHLQKLIDIFQSSKINTGSIKFEVTESAIMEDADKAFEQLNNLKKHGFALSIDDFGTGHSSLSYILKYPFDYLKIDRSFVSFIDQDRKKRTLVKAILGICQDLGLKTVGEGVERLEEIEELQNLGCQFAQGFYFSKPLPALEILDLLSSGVDDREFMVIQDSSSITERFGFSLKNTTGVNTLNLH